MVAISRTPVSATRGVDLEIGIVYRPPEGETLDGLVFTAQLAGLRLEYPADVVEFDPVAGSITATWQEATTRRLTSGQDLEARIIRWRGDRSRLLYVRPVRVR